jgi:hypothetical protein
MFQKEQWNLFAGSLVVMVKESPKRKVLVMYILRKSPQHR